MPERSVAANNTWLLSVDGTAWPNPGKIGLGVVLRSPDGTTLQQSIPLGRSGCNNEAELRALCLGLETAKTAGVSTLVVMSDSDFVVRHSRGEMTTQTAHLQALVNQAQRLMAGFAKVELTWVPRHRNTEADRLARGALGLIAKPVARPGRRRKK
ncbi:MAG TPA: ribonuclease HI family protein [Rhodocyclaceae bacterium]|nr:ribonuclease HI family protein [Rhodocyclaceae bacterium]